MVFLSDAEFAEALAKAQGLLDELETLIYRQEGYPDRKLEDLLRAGTVCISRKEMQARYAVVKATEADHKRLTARNGDSTKATEQATGETERAIVKLQDVIGFRTKSYTRQAQEVANAQTRQAQEAIYNADEIEEKAEIAKQAEDARREREAKEKTEGVIQRHREQRAHDYSE